MDTTQFEYDQKDTTQSKIMSGIFHFVSGKV